MSVITDMVILVGCVDYAEPIRALNDWCKREASRQCFEKISFKQSGGRKVFTTDVFACSGNAFPWRELLVEFPKLPWGKYMREETVLLVNDEHVEAWIGVRADGKPLGWNEKTAHRSPFDMVETKKDGYLIELNGVYWHAVQTRWVNDPEEATVFGVIAARCTQEGWGGGMKGSRLLNAETGEVYKWPL